MTDYTWLGTVSQDSTVADNWLPVGTPTSGDKAIFDAAAAQPCDFALAAIDEIEIAADFIQTVNINIDIALIGLSVSAAGSIVASAPRSLVFSGTPLYKSGSCYIEIGTSSSPFDSILSRDNLIYSVAPSTGDLYFDTGIYPNMKLAGGGNKTPQYITPTVADTTDVNFLTLRLSAGTFQPASSTPTDNDKLKNFIIDSSTNQFIVDAGGLTEFDGGYATWTFQGATSGFLIPTSNLSEYQGCDFTFRKMAIMATDGGAGAWAKIAANSRLCLDDFTVGVGASVKGAGPSAIHLINRPTIKGTWGFFPIADGIYHHKDGEVLGIAHGGTGLSNVGEYEIPFGTEANTLTTSSRLTFDNNLNELTIDGKLTVSGLIDPTGMVFTPQTSNPEITNPQNTIWVNNEDGHLYRGDRDVEGMVHFNVRNDEGTTIPLGAPLYSRGEIGGSNRIKVGIADASDPAKMPCIGISMQEMNTTSTKDGNMILSGIFNQNITITNVVEQSTIYVAPHGGTAPYLTITRPTSGSHLIQNIGICVRQAAANVSQGMVVSAIGRTNDIPNAVITTNSADADYVYIDDGNTFKKITPSNLGIGGGGGGSGTVSSVDMTVPTGFAISGNPITGTGTLALAFDTGYALPTSAKQTQWDTAYGWGDHSTQGYLTSTPPETDPIFSASPAASITNAGSGDVSQGDTAFGWGDHAGLYATAAQGATADAALPKAGGTMTGEIEGTTITLNAIPADPATDTKVRLGESDGSGSNNMLRIQTDAGYLDIGPNNSGYAHFMTNRDRMYFNKPIIVDGGGYFLAYNDGLKLGTGTSVGGATIAIEAANGSPDITVAGTTTSTGFIKTGGLATEYLMADGSVSTGGGGGGGTPSGVAGAIQFSDGAAFASDDANLHYDDGNNRLGVGTNTPSETLHVKGNVLIEDSTTDGSSDHLLEVKSGQTGTPDNARIIISADTDVKLPMLHLRDIEANGGTFNANYSAYVALDRATPIVSGSAQNDLLIANGNLNKDIHLCTNDTSAGSATTARLTITSDGDVGIGTTAPDNPLHVVGAGNFPFRVQADEGNLRMNRYGHLHIQNDNSSPTDGDTIDSPLWSVGQRDGGQFDIAFGNAVPDLVSYADRLLVLQRAGNSATGQKQIGFLGASPTGAIDDGFGAPLMPISPMLMGPTPNEAMIAGQLDAILAGLQTLGLFL